MPSVITCASVQIYSRFIQNQDIFFTLEHVSRLTPIQKKETHCTVPNQRTLCKRANPTYLKYFLIYLKVVSLNCHLANIVLAFKLFLARIYLRKNCTYLEFFLSILSDRGRAIVQSCVPFCFNTGISY